MRACVLKGTAPGRTPAIPQGVAGVPPGPSDLPDPAVSELHNLTARLMAMLKSRDEEVALLLLKVGGNGNLTDAQPAGAPLTSDPPSEGAGRSVANTTTSEPDPEGGVEGPARTPDTPTEQDDPEGESPRSGEVEGPERAPNHTRPTAAPPGGAPDPPAGAETNASEPLAGDKDGGPVHRERESSKGTPDIVGSHFGPGGLGRYLTDWGRWAANGIAQLSVWLSGTICYYVQAITWVLGNLLWEWLEREFLAWCADWCTEAYRAVRIFLGCVFAGFITLALAIMYFLCTFIVIPLVVGTWKAGRGVLHATSYLLGKRPWQAPNGLEWYGSEGANDLTEDWLRGPFKQRSDTGQKPPDVVAREAGGGA
jgi:hypothetical protein